MKKILTKKENKPKMPNEDREILKLFYNEYVQKLKTILKRDLPWKDFQILNE